MALLHPPQQKVIAPFKNASKDGPDLAPALRSKLSVCLAAAFFRQSRRLASSSSPRNPIIHQKLNGTESQRTPLRKLLYRAIRYSGYFRGPFFRGSDVLEITFSSEWLVMEPQYQKRFVSVIFVHPQTINHPLKYGEVFGSLGLFVEAARPKTTLGRGLDS